MSRRAVYRLSVLIAVNAYASITVYGVIVGGPLLPLRLHGIILAILIVASVRAIVWPMPPELEPAVTVPAARPAADVVDSRAPLLRALEADTMYLHTVKGRAQVGRRSSGMQVSGGVAVLPRPSPGRHEEDSDRYLQGFIGEPPDEDPYLRGMVSSEMDVANYEAEQESRTADEDPPSNGRSVAQ